MGIGSQNEQGGRFGVLFDEPLAIRLQLTSEGSLYFKRVESEREDVIGVLDPVEGTKVTNLKSESIYVAQEYGKKPSNSQGYNNFQIRLSVTSSGVTLSEMYPSDLLDGHGRFMPMRPLSNTGIGALRFTDSHDHEFVVFLKWKCDSSMAASIDKPKYGQTLEEMVCTSDFANKENKTKRYLTTPVTPDRVFWQHPDCSRSC